jgi:DNA-binding winged helix-turn-helix (wHTH) protein
MQETRTSFMFPPYRLDPDERNLRRDADLVSLTPKEFDTLLALVEASGRVVEKEELIRRVWPDSYVGDGSLARNISVLRKALGEEVIETLPKKGYRIALPVTRVEVGPPLSIAKSNLEPEPLPPPVTSTHAASRWKPRFVIWPSLAAVVLLVVAFRLIGIRSARARPVPESIPPVRSVLIQKEGATDPVDEGFQLHAPDGQYPKVLYNRETNGWDRWRIKSIDQNYFYRALNAAEKDFALARNWKVTCVCALEAGAGFAAIDFAGKGARFDMEFFREGNRYFVGLTRQITPTLEWDQKIESAGIADVAHPHAYELRYDHATQTASLWIDGQKRADAYRGYHQFQEDRGLFFGAEIYGQSTEGSFVFRSVSFEAQ